MIESPEIAQTSAHTAAVIRLKIPRSEIQAVMGPAIEELMAAVFDQGIGPQGPLFAHHFAMSPDIFDFEVGVPVDAPVAPVGRVKPGELPGATVARTVYRGPYEGLRDAWREFGTRVKEDLGDRLEREGLRPGETLWERYVAGPESNPDPSTWRTELNQPLVEA